MSVVVSIIIPTFNEESNLKKAQFFYTTILKNKNIELLIVDGGSTDNTIAIAENFATSVIKCATKCRAAQMNNGASIAKGNILYFVHADVTLHPDFYNHIQTYLQQGVDVGCYRYIFDSNNYLLRFNAYMTRFNGMWAGGGDQTLFIKKSMFEKLNGFNNDCLIMEDFDFVKRIKKVGYNFAILPYNVLVSARKYENNSWLRVQFSNAIIIVAWKFGASQQWMKITYGKLLRN